MAKKTIDEPMSVGIDIGKDTLHIVAFDPHGQLVMRKQIKRLALVQTFEKLPRCMVGLEACWNRWLCAIWISKARRMKH